MDKEIIKELIDKRICRQGLKEAVLLSEVAERVESGVIVEIGRNRGGSLVILAKSSTNSYVYSIDRHDHKDAGTLDLCNKYGITNYKMLVGDSGKIGESWDKEKEIDLLFVDGDHSYEGVYRDLRIWVPYVKKFGIVMMHDCPLRSWSKNKRKIRTYEPSRKALRRFNSKNGDLKTITTARTMRYLIKQ